MFGVGMAFDNETIGTRGNGGAAHGAYEMGMSGSMRGVHYDGQMCFVVQLGHNGQAQGVSHVFFKCSYAAFTENDLWVSRVDNVFRGE